MSSQDSQDAQESSQQEEAQQEKQNEPSTTSVSIAVGTEDLNPATTTSAPQPEPTGEFLLPYFRVHFFVMHLFFVSLFFVFTLHSTVNIYI